MEKVGTRAKKRREEQRTLLSDWLFDFVVFSLLTARNESTKKAAKAKVFLRSFGQDGVLRFTKCDVFLLAHSTYGGVDKIFNMRILLSALQKELT